MPPPPQKKKLLIFPGNLIMLMWKGLKWVLLTNFLFFSPCGIDLDVVTKLLLSINVGLGYCDPKIWCLTCQYLSDLIKWLFGNIS